MKKNLIDKLSRKEKLDFILATRGITRDDKFILNEYKLMSDDELDIEFDYYYNSSYWGGVKNG